MIITTAQIPGRPAPRLITADAVKGMAPGSVIIDLAAETGGNVEGSKPGETVEENGVKIIGPANLPSQMAGNASALYAKNLQNLVELLIDDEGNLKVDTEDEVIAGACLTKDGEIVNERAKEAAGQLRMDLITEITIFVLAAFVGFEVISKVPTTLHTPLMSQTNAIHGIVMLGGLIVIGSADDTLEKVIGVIAIAFGTINIVGGFMVTDRMLGMFGGRKRKPKTESEPETVTPGRVRSVTPARCAVAQQRLRHRLLHRRLLPVHLRDPAGDAPAHGPPRQPDRRRRDARRDRDHAVART